MILKATGETELLNSLNGISDNMIFSTNYMQTHNGIQLSFKKNISSLFGLRSNIQDIDLREWSTATNSSATLAIAEITKFAEIYPEEFQQSDRLLTLGWGLLAKLSNNSLKALGLPENPPYSFSLEMNGSLLTTNFEIIPKWGNANNPRRMIQNGAFLKDSSTGREFIIPDPIYSIMNLIEDHNEIDGNDVPERMRLCAKILSHVNTKNDETIDPEQSAVKLEGALKKFKVKTAKSLSLNLTHQSDGYHITPVFFGDSDKTSTEQKTEKDGLLTEKERLEFEYNKSSGYLASKQAKRTYLLADGEYLLIDDNLFPALDHIKNVSKMSKEDRKDFATNPAKSLTEVYRKFVENLQIEGLDSDLQEEQIEGLISEILVETQEFSERVTGLGLWNPPVLPYIKQAPNSWEPEEFGLFFGETFIPLTIEDINPLKEAVEAAIDAGKTKTVFKGKEIPVTEDTLQALSKLQGIVQPTPPEPKTTPQKQPEVLLIKENFDDLTFERKLNKRDRFEEKSISSKIKARLMEHQTTSLKWQIDAYLSGLPGILNADDQGLGKTLQTIAFLAWLQENMRIGPDQNKKPILIVAPTSLLKNWGNEVLEHMTDEFGLGARLDAYGSSLKRIKSIGSDGKIKLDLGLGLDARPDSKICWILTTYTTLKEHQIEFAKLDFAAVVFDEIQAIKNVSTLAHRAALSLKSDFNIGLTGTPVENAVSDLWAIIDTLSPGYLGSLKDFVNTYNEAGIGEFKGLHEKLFQDSYSIDDKTSPPLALRRMKSDTIADLPKKNYKLYPEIMSAEQEIAYDSAFLEINDASKGKILKILHRLRGVSLYPGKIELLSEEENPLVSLVQRSARFKSAMEILDNVKKQGEKALIFLESHDMQYALSGLLTKKYGLDRVPIINGQVMPFKRGKIVDEFQKTIGDGKFELLILSPKAAGVGLTLTAATHIIHLSRWWNPAIEEQCNDRIYRIGQDKNVTIHVPIAVHSKHQTRSFDCILNDIMLRKRKLFREVLMPTENLAQDQNNILGELTGHLDFDISQIDNLDWKAFEKWAGQKAIELGAWTVSTTPRTGDGGLDIYLRHVERDSVVLVQCKHTSRNDKFLGTAPVKEILYAADRYDTKQSYQSVVITNAEGFVEEARRLALENNVVLIDRHHLALWPNHII
ncbi:SNF2-related protein [Rhodobacteraceae bacterium]|nr:SNF2-related protein [Paracoccaceae bacterium]